MSFFEENTPKIVSTIVLLVCVTIIRFIITTLIKRYAKHAEINEHRAILVSKYISIVIMAITLAGVFMIWGVRTNDIYIAFTSVITIIGVAFFAQWSILSNITAGIILFFSFPFKIGDTIRIHDKDFPLEGEIDDIKAFHTYLRTKEGELVTYPNNLLLQKGVSIVNTTREEREFMD
ncbi:MAG: mechanosensitive ion channel family protein [Flavobacterium lindanitolerans]|uniref:mechanosensitive ion channel domain-containing protein n=1 Tax=Flavobacterium TaxID=237 RepID=UPI0006FEFCFF|nr:MULTISPECIES: mechanosensitive ion channel domain-containing protein [Flavobacterium]MBU7571413.1 mechanosensitive ion channel family protein [Flavobacterium sp.]PZO33579.1 MAG: mechanosensitive ion channel protein MscS [Flavobacteriaceae bacterium]PZQ92660.1 MAG: mechanosensitive ion channel protein MscS [Flavobacterium johnsoniae]KQS53440.1 mechanosensitive ion channel protein MscS [Flavobacterium sp. Leaf359]MBL7869380.1 mechanosensitive ion channel family protein [Flavobacterium lindani